MIAIPNMDKPKSCEKCPTHSFTFGDEYVSSHDYCGALKKPFNVKKLDIDPFKETLPDCPLIDIVTCKECIHKIQALSTEKGATGCELISGTFYEDFFCKEGERRSDESDIRRD